MNADVAITGWSGRVGNNLLQVLKALLYGDRVGGRIAVPATNNPVLRPVANRAYNDTGSPRDNVVKRPFFYDRDVSDISIPSPISINTLRTVAEKYAITSSIQNHLAPFSSSIRNDDNDLHIHIRSGDIFSSSNPHPNYWQPPLLFYRRIIDEHLQRFGASVPIVIVTEKDERNPCINKIRRMYSSARVQTTSVEKDFATLVHAKHIVCSVGTFSTMAAVLSDSVKTVHIPYWTSRPCPNSFVLGYAREGTTVMEYTIDHYAMQPWRNARHQRQQMLYYNGHIAGTCTTCTTTPSS